eukprot:TRINITY_DN21935_c0_g1_i1.p2 TRINITY_DN21935_c0_g1~~TRINITY_DN21935_c0_g1_i1.p2  ORF type:complete len:112 (-),score=5.37 TRINITY_DN21935_c0_g1_i1:726-1061(-)
MKPPKQGEPSFELYNKKKSARVEDTDLMTSSRWLNMWQSSMEQGLKGCKGMPTIIFDSSLIKAGPETSLSRLLELLTLVGVKGLRMLRSSRDTGTNHETHSSRTSAVQCQP